MIDAIFDTIFGTISQATPGSCYWNMAINSILQSSGLNFFSSSFNPSR